MCVYNELKSTEYFSLWCQVLSYVIDWKLQNVEKSFLNNIAFHSFLSTNNDDTTHRVSFMKNLPLFELSRPLPPAALYIPLLP